LLSAAIRELRDFTGDDPFELKPRSDRKDAKPRSPPERFVTPVASRGPVASAADITFDVDESDVVEDTEDARRRSVISASPSPRRSVGSNDDYDEPIDQYFLQEAESPSRTRQELSVDVDEQLEASKSLLAQIDRLLPKVEPRPAQKEEKREEEEEEEEEDAELDDGTYNRLMAMSLSGDSSD
jgi:hypothetical protein